MEKTSLTVIVPVYNEEHLVESSLRRLFFLAESDCLDAIQVVVVDDGSQDATPEILKRLAEELPGANSLFNWVFVTQSPNQGKGRAIQRALEYASGEITIIHDSDLEYHPRDILRMIPLFIEEGADVVYGSRFLVHEYRRVLLFRHELGNRILTFFSNWFSNLNLSDMETCYKAVKTALLKSIPLRSKDFRIEPELTIKLAKRNARIFEVPINYSGRTYQEGKKIKWIDGLKALGAIIKFGFSDDIFVEDQYGSKMLARLNRAHRFNAWMAETIRPFIGQRVLEIGSGIGNLTRQLIPRKNYWVTDINPLYLRLMKNIKEDKPYLSVIYLDLNDVSEFIGEGHLFDTVICLNVIEHLENDLQAMQNIADLILSGGKAVILVPNGPSIFGTLDEVLGHHRRYKAQDLHALAEQAGLSIERIIPFNRMGYVPWLVNGRLLKRKTFGFLQISVLNLLTPVFRRIDAYLPFPPLSHIAVLEKTAATANAGSEPAAGSSEAAAN